LQFFKFSSWQLFHFWIEHVHLLMADINYLLSEIKQDNEKFSLSK